MKFYYLVHIEDPYIQVDIPYTSPFLSYSSDIYQMDNIQIRCNNRPWGNLHILCIFIEISKQLINVFQPFFCTILFRLKYANLFLEHDSFCFNQSAKLIFLLSDVINRFDQPIKKWVLSYLIWTLLTIRYYIDLKFEIMACCIIKLLHISAY